jgi:two-component system response regulator RegA
MGRTVGRTVLVVDDEDSVRRALRELLGARGYDVHCAHDLRSALAALEAGPVDAAVVDQNLRGKLGDRSGLDVVDELSRAGVRVVVYTGWPDADAAFRAGHAGAAAYLTKPATTAELAAAIDGSDDAEPSPAASLQRVERDYVARVVACCGGNLTRAAEALGVPRRSLQRLVARRPRRR